MEATVLSEGGDENTIVGGTPTAGQEFPFFVQSEIKACGGSLVTKDMVLTAAHCYRKQQIGDSNWMPR